MVKKFYTNLCAFFSLLFVNITQKNLPDFEGKKKLFEEERKEKENNQKGASRRGTRPPPSHGHRRKRSFGERLPRPAHPFRA